MKQPTFQEQYNKITTAYYKDELNPLLSCACFVGNLLNNTIAWDRIRCFTTKQLRPHHPLFNIGLRFIKQESNGFYSPEDILKLENNFLDKCYPDDIDRIKEMSSSTKLDEDNLFNATTSTLELLREIHESKGEIVQDYNFTKRNLEKV